MSLYEHVKEACKENGISVSALENKLNFPRSSICKWDSNRPSVDKLKSVADELNKTMDYFLNED